MKLHRLALVVVVFAVLVCGCTAQVEDDMDIDIGDDESSDGDVDGVADDGEKEVVDNPARAHYQAKVATVVAGNVDGIVAVRLWDGDDISAVVHLLWPQTGVSERIISPDVGVDIGYVAMSKSLIAWVEHSDSEWVLKLKQLTGDREETIAWGSYTEVTGPDFPTPALTDQYLVYNVSHDSGDVMKSEIVLWDIDASTGSIIDRIECNDTYTGPPSICDGVVAWHRGQWTDDMDASIFIYDIAAEQIETLPRKPHVGQITPVVCGDWIAWVEYEKQHPEAKNVYVSRLSEHEPRLLTDAKADNRREYLQPTMTRGALTWRQNMPRDYVPLQPVLYDGDNQVVVAVQSHSNAIYGSWVTWRQIDHRGVFFASLTRTGPRWDYTPQPGSELMVPADIDMSLDELKQASPVDAFTAYAVAVNNDDFDMLEILCKPELFDQIMEGGYEKYTTISPHYIICGDMAYVAAKKQGIDGWINLRMQYVDGMWKMPFLAAQ